MRMKVSRGRGRPRGKCRSPADFRLLQYLALISMKYGIDSEKFFDSFVEAWKRQQSTCKSLLIECRRRTRDYAVFLITNSFKVVAQFHISKHILEETIPLKEFAYAKVEGRQRWTIERRREKVTYYLGTSFEKTGKL